MIDIENVKASWLACKRFSSAPACVCPVIAEFVRSWNDSISHEDLRKRLVKDVVPMAFNTNDGKGAKRSDMAYESLVREFVPAFLDLVPESKAHADKLRESDLADALSISLSGDTAVRASKMAAESAAGMPAAWLAARSSGMTAASLVGSGRAELHVAMHAASSAAGYAVHVSGVADTWATASEALAPTVADLQLSARKLLTGMCEL